MNALAEKYGDKVAILGYPCNQFGHQTNEDNADDAPPVVLEGLETLGSVKVIASMSFPPPPAGEATSYALAGAYSDISLDLPAGAWPSDLTVGPSIAIFEMPASDRRGQVAGLGVNLGPDGTHFAVPVTISAPVDSNLDLGNKELRIHRFTPKTDNATLDKKSDSGS